MTVTARLSTAARLRQVRNLLEDPESWSPWEAQDAHGYPCEPNSKKAVRWSLAAALRLVEPNSGPAWAAVRKAVARRYGGEPDDESLPWRFGGLARHAEILTVLDAAIEAAVARAEQPHP